MSKYLSHSFFHRLEAEPLPAGQTVGGAEIERVLAAGRWQVSDLPILLAVRKPEHMAVLLETAGQITRQRFGARISLYAPVYVSNICSNQCAYCGFRQTEKQERVRLSPDEVLIEAGYLHEIGLRHVLVVAGEDQRQCAGSDLEEITARLAGLFSWVGIEIQPLTEAGYGRLLQQGLDSVTLYQETYDPEAYGRYHLAGPKRDFRYRLEAPERVARAGVPNMGIGALLGLVPPAAESLRLARHLEYLIDRYWRVNFALSFPRIRQENLGFTTPCPVGDHEFVRLIAAMRLIFPDTPFYLSTRESALLRDNLIHYGITHLSAESSTRPGGYRLRPDSPEQFHVGDNRPLGVIAAGLTAAGIRLVFKDWDRGLRPRPNGKVQP